MTDMFGVSSQDHRLGFASRRDQNVNKGQGWTVRGPALTALAQFSQGALLLQQLRLRLPQPGAHCLQLLLCPQAWDGAGHLDLQSCYKARLQPPGSAPAPGSHSSCGRLGPLPSARPATPSASRLERPRPTHPRQVTLGDSRGHPSPLRGQPWDLGVSTHLLINPEAPSLHAPFVLSRSWPPNNASCCLEAAERGSWGRGTGDSGTPSPQGCGNSRLGTQREGGQGHSHRMRPGAEGRQTHKATHTHSCLHRHSHVVHTAPG